MGQILKLENLTDTDLELQVELSGEVAKIPQSSMVLIDTDFDNSEEIHIQLKAGRLIVWGGVAAHIVHKSPDT